MRPANWRVRGWCKTRSIIFSAFALSVLPLPVAEAQLAITEIMSRPSFNDAGVQGFDFFELTNFGTNSIGLTGYQFADAKSPLMPLPSEDLTISPQESIIFFRCKTNVSPGEFSAWWGLTPGLPVCRWVPDPGLSQYGDSLKLFDPCGNLIDRVDFGVSPPFVSLIYDTNFGAIGVPSVLGTCGAFAAAGVPDVGSPGTTCGPVPLRFVEQPTNVTVTECSDAELSFVATGLPRPIYQWLFNGEPLPGATGLVLEKLEVPTRITLQILNAKQTNGGNYSVVLTNGLEVLTSACAIVTVITNPCPPAVVSPPKDCTVFVGDTAVFIVTVSGYPCAAFQWFRNGTPISGETGQRLAVQNCELDMSGSVYCVQASNDLGSTGACAVLTVIEPPDGLQITEAMARRSVPTREHKDWFELTNFSTNSVDLSGYRFICMPAGDVDITTLLQEASVVPEGVVIKPGETIIFVDAFTREQFIGWWGADNLPPDLQIITWWGWGINWEGGEALVLWGRWTTEPHKYLILQDTGRFTDGVSLYFDANDLNCLLGRPSIAGERGAFFAVQDGAIGSPGYAPVLKILSIELDAAGFMIKARSVAGRKYVLEYTTSLPSSWARIGGSQTATNDTVVFLDAPTAGARFYTVKDVTDE